MRVYSYDELRVAHKHSFGNWEEIIQSKKCVCFCCFAEFGPTEIVLFDEEDSGQKTAYCPSCSVDAVLGDACGFELTPELIDALAYEYFYGMTRELMAQMRGGAEARTLAIEEAAESKREFLRTLADVNQVHGSTLRKLVQ